MSAMPANSITNSGTEMNPRRIIATPPVFSTSVSADHVIDLRIHVVGHMDYLRIALVRALRQDHVHELGHHIDVRVLQIALLQRPHSAAASRHVRYRVA